MLPEQAVRHKEFLSTPSARRATKEIYAQGNTADISIHALREEGDAASASSSAIWANFYPRPPRGGRRCSRSNRGCGKVISIHALREEGDTGIHRVVLFIK